MISRRPKSLASREKKPGPSMATASEITISSRRAGMQSKRRAEGSATNELEIITAAAAIARLVIEVKKPIRTQIPQGMSIAAPARDIQETELAIQIDP